MLTKLKAQFIMKALLEKMSIEKNPFLHIIIKLTSQVIKISKKKDISPFLYSIIEKFKIVKIFFTFFQISY